MSAPKKFLGLAKTIANANVSELSILDDGSLDFVTLLLERWTRQKWCGRWPVEILEALGASEKSYQEIVDNRDITTPDFIEELYEKKSLFYELLKKKNLQDFSRHFNEELKYLPHHMAHAYSAVALMPYDEALILVIDGGGTKGEDYRKSSYIEYESWSKGLSLEANEIEHISLYMWKNGQLTGLLKRGLKYQEFDEVPMKLSEGLGSAYEKCAHLIFNDPLASGKVMGLAGFGKSFYQGEGLLDLQQRLPWNKRFQGKSKKEWQNSSFLQDWKDVAATIQEAFEKHLFDLIKDIQSEFSNLRKMPLVYTGGCALNCTANFKLQKLWQGDLYIPPNPGDEGISLGLALAVALKNRESHKLVKKSIEEQNSAFGLNHKFDKGLFEERGHQVREITSFKEVAKILKSGEIIAWYQGRAECGPRALGHRSLLARVDEPGLKARLNQTIKFREDFRPYGATVLWERATTYFDVDKNFHNPFMAFAVPIKEEVLSQLKEVSHIDGTCRMQTVTQEQNQAYYDLITCCEKEGMIPMLLNTSLNIMGEPIVETPADALRFLEQSEVKTLVLNNYLIRKSEAT